jgi:hypothetical protein
MTDRPTNNFVMRIIGAVSLDVAIYEEVEADRGATGQAMVVVVLSNLAAGVGAIGMDGISLRAAVVIAVMSLALWAAWALLTFQIGANILPEPQTRADVGELLRTIGFSAAPGVLRIFGVIQGVTLPAFAMTSVWMLLSMIVAVRQALDYKSTGRAVAVCALGWVLAMAMAVALGLFFGPTVS